MRDLCLINLPTPRHSCRMLVLSLLKMDLVFCDFVSYKRLTEKVLLFLNDRLS